MRIVKPGDLTYECSARVSNARFDYRPRLICYCAKPDDVKEAIRKAKQEKLGVRIRSGGHQHEGMSSGDGVLVIDLSEINHITFSSDPTAWIGSGAKLAAVYKETLKKNWILPGGGCGDVCVGGLVQGGGWGPYARAFGLTCDSLIGFRMVKASGEEIVVDSKSGKDKDLLWAVRGAGGGNFGVITEFRFALPLVPEPIWSFTLTWSDPSLRSDVIEEWRNTFPNDGEFKLTSFCRVSATPGEDPPVIVGGNWLGDRDPLEAHLRKLLSKTYSKCTALFEPVPKTTAPEHRLAFHHPEYQPGPPPAALRATGLSAEEAPKNTCDGGWYPHKVSSCFPASYFSDQSTKTIDDYLKQTRPEPDARRYLSLHSFGGKIKTFPVAGDWSCFPFRAKPFLLQYQAWWGDKNDHALGRRCLAWIRDFRETMRAHTEGAFINFPDKDLVRTPGTLEGRKKLLGYYYATNLDRLIKVKEEYDRENFFNFEMSVPTRPTTAPGEPKERTGE